MFLSSNNNLYTIPTYGGPGETRTPEKPACKAGAMATRRQAHVRIALFPTNFHKAEQFTRAKEYQSSLKTFAI